MQCNFTTPRDSQRSKVYKAERACSWWSASEEMSLKECEKLIDRLLGRHYKWKGERRRVRWGGYRLADGRGSRSGAANDHYIRLPKFARNRGYVAHEVAHMIHFRLMWVKEAAHGWEYCSIYLQVVTAVFGKEASDELKESFKKHKVKFRAPRKGRVLSEEEKQVLRERLAKARAAKSAA